METTTMNWSEPEPQRMLDVVQGVDHVNEQHNLSKGDAVDVYRLDNPDTVYSGFIYQIVTKNDVDNIYIQFPQEIYPEILKRGLSVFIKDKLCVMGVLILRTIYNIVLNEPEPDSVETEETEESEETKETEPAQAQSPILQSRPMTRGYALKLYKEAHPEQYELSESESDYDSNSDSDTEIVFGKPYKRGEHENVIGQFVVKSFIIFMFCILWATISIEKIKSNGPHTGDYIISRPMERSKGAVHEGILPSSPYQMNVPNQVCMEWDVDASRSSTTKLHRRARSVLP